MPDVFVMQNPIRNAMAIGRDRPFIVMTTGLVNLHDEEELRWVVGHELGHVLSGHAVYRTMLLILIQLAARIAWMPIGYLGLRAIIWGLEEWFRKSELSCDRAGLLAGQDVDAARRALMKLAGGSQLSELNPDAFREQAHEYDAVPDLRDSVLKLLQLQDKTHPFAVVRFAELDDRATHRDYERILGGDYPRRETDRSASVARRRATRRSPTRTGEPLGRPARRHLPRRRGDRRPGGERAVRPPQPATRRRHGRHGRHGHGLRRRARQRPRQRPWQQRQRAFSPVCRDDCDSRSGQFCIGALRARCGHGVSRGMWPGCWLNRQIFGSTCGTSLATLIEQRCAISAREFPPITLPSDPVSTCTQNPRHMRTELPQ